MDQHEIKVRAAQPDVNEGLTFARYLEQAAEGFFRLMLGPRVDQIIASAYMEPHNDFSYQHITFAECDNTLVGMVSGYTAEQQRRSSDRALRRAAGKSGLWMMGVALLFAPMLRYLNTHTEGDFYIQAIAVNKAFRGHGIGTTLLDCIENQARAIGSTQLALHVSGKNERAIKLYRRRGMAVTSQWPKRWLKPGTIVQMTKLL